MKTKIAIGLLLIIFFVPHVANAKDLNHKLCVYASRGDTAQMKALIAMGADVNGRDNVHNWTPLMWTAINNHVDAAKLLVKSGADVNAKESSGGTALMEAAHKNSVHVAKLLIENGADINAKDKYGQTALLLALVGFSSSTAKLLIEKGADVNVRDDGKTPLIWAVERHMTEVVKLLIDKGADVNARDDQGLTALKIAIYDRDSSPEIVKLLRQAGAKE